MNIRINVNRAQLRAFVAKDGAELVRDTTRRVANYAKVLAPVDTGRLRGSIRTRVEARGLQVTGTVAATARHAVWVHEGTGLYGPRHTYITPRRGRYLVFPGRSGQTVFARRVAGVRPRRFLVQALRRGADGWRIRVYTPGE
jgi:hypothetical protein